MLNKNVFKFNHSLYHRQSLNLYIITLILSGKITFLEKAFNHDSSISTFANVKAKKFYNQLLITPSS